MVDSSTSGRPITWDNMRGICEGISDMPRSYGLSPALCSKFLHHMESPFQPYPCACGTRIWEQCGAVPARTKRCYVREPRGDSYMMSGRETPKPQTKQRDKMKCKVCLVNIQVPLACYGCMAQDSLPLRKPLPNPIVQLILRLCKAGSMNFWTKGDGNEDL